VVVVEGLAGVGKSRLIAEAMAIAKEKGLSVGSGVAAASDQAVPMGPLVAAVLPLVDSKTRSSLPYLPEQRYWLLEELEGSLETLAMKSALLLCIDDVQWADSAFLAALRTLPVRLMTFPIVWLVAYRSPQAPPELRAVVESLEQIGVDRLPLRPLSDAAVAEIVSDAFGAEPGGALREMVQQSQGSPFLLVELLHGLQEENLVHVASGVAELVEMRLPGRVREGMQERLAGMSDLARRAALVASVLERRFSFDQLSMMLDEPVPALLGPVDELVRAELLTEEAGLLVFRHDLIREAVRDTLPASARRSLQRQAVDVLLATGAVPGDVAVQLAASAEPGDGAAVQTLHEASRALAASGPGTAADLSRRALDLASKDDPLRGTLAADTALLLHAAGRAVEGKEFADRILGEVLPAEQEGQVRLSIARMLALSADVRADSGRRALALPRLSAPLRVRHLATLAHNLVGAGRFEEARMQLDEAREAVERSGDVNAIFTLEFAEAALHYATADVGRALEMTEAALRDRQGVDEPQRVLVTEELRAEQLAALDRYKLSRRLTSEGLMAAQRAHQEWGVRLWDRWRGRQLLQLGRLSDAAAALEGIGDLGDDANPASNHDAAALVALARLAIHRGDQSRRRRCAELGQGLVQNGPPLVRRHGAWLLALLASADGNHAEARAQLDVAGDAEHLQILPRFPLDVTDEVDLVRIATAAGDADLAETALSSARDRARLNPGVCSIAGASAHVQALMGDDRDAYAEAIENLEQGPRPLALASALEDCGRLCADRGNAADAIEELGRALEIYARLGASWDAGRVRRRLRSLGVRRRLPAAPTARNGWAALTDSELAVVGLVVQGMTNREVADRLFVSPHTVDSHLRHIFEKLSVNSRMELALVAARHGLSGS
jgi:DNA-binding CsgD family transcriptional regulator